MTTATKLKLAVSFDLERLNQQFDSATPQEILAWSIQNVPIGLVQTSAFNVDDIVITHILYNEFDHVVPVIFLDTLYHFQETLELVNQVQTTYNLDLRTYKTPDVDTRAAFVAKYGEALWEKDLTRFHQITKIEPLQRGLNELKTVAWITGRRRDQAVTRANMPVFELDSKNRLKINPLAAWTRSDSWDYVTQHNLIYNPLHDQGYPSIGDEPLTTKISLGEDERAGRWRGTDKTECGIHV
jgi:phosphoadenosine phosphosulfate reductase